MCGPALFWPRAESGCGATVVNAYLAEDSLADRIGSWLLDMKRLTAMARYREGRIDQGLLKSWPRMGISRHVVLPRRPEFRAVGLKPAPCVRNMFHPA